MAIANYSNSTGCDTCTTPNEQAIAAPVLPSITSCPVTCQDGSVSPVIPLPTLPDGIPWVVDYYGQVLKSGDVPAPIDTYLNPVFQRLINIRDMTLYVTSPLTTNYNAATGETTREGEATFVGIWTPNIGDAFIKVLDNNIPYILRITDVAPILATTQTNYRITYQVFQNILQHPDITLDLSHKVATVDNYRFSSEGYLSGGVGVVSVTEENSVTAEEQATWLSTILCQWERYYDRDSACYVVSTTNGRVYDPYVNAVMARYTNNVTNDTLNLQKTWQRMVSNHYQTTDNTIYAVLMGGCSGNPIIPNLYSRLDHNGRLGLGQLRHTTIEFMVGSDSFATGDGALMSTILGSTLHTNGYVVSSVYATGDTVAMSPLERLIHGIKVKSVTSGLIADAYTQFLTLNTIDQYWMIPFLLVALRRGVV